MGKPWAHDRRAILFSSKCQAEHAHQQNFFCAGRGGFASTSDSTPSTSHIIQRSRQTSRHLSKKDFSTSAVVKEAHLLYAQPDIAAGLLVEFKRDQKAGLALLQQPDGHKNWRAVDPRSVLFKCSITWQHDACSRTKGLSVPCLTFPSHSGNL